MIGNRKVIDCFTFFDELDLLEIRLHEMDKIADKFIICECREDYGGKLKPLNFLNNAERYGKFKDKIVYAQLEKLEPYCKDRTTGRMREAFQRDAIGPFVRSVAKRGDIISFGDCDEIPSARAIIENLDLIMGKPHRLKQYSFYYNINVLTDYGHDWASRARVAKFEDFDVIPSAYEFRMLGKNGADLPDQYWKIGAKIGEIENGGWHFSYFGGIERIDRKVASLRPFLSEYKLFGSNQLIADILDRKDLHHRKCELPETFRSVPTGEIMLPEYLTANIEKFHHFTEAYFREKYRGEPCSAQSAQG